MAEDDYLGLMKTMKTLIALAAMAMACLSSFAQTTWHNPVKEGAEIHGQGWNELNHTYFRLPDKAKDVVRKEVWNLSRNSAGLSVVFRSNASRISLRYQVEGNYSMFHMPSTGKSGVDMYATDSEGKLHWFAPDFPQSFADTIRYNYSHITYYPEGATDYEYEVYFPLYNTLKWIEIGVPEGSEFSFVEVEKEPKVVLYGTSIAQGACASKPGMAWSNIIDREMRIPMVNLGFSGNGKLEPEMFDLLAEIDASWYIIDCLPNMSKTAPVTQLVIDGVRTLKAARNCGIILVEHNGYAGESTDSSKSRYRKVNELQKAAFEKLVQDGVRDIYYVTTEDLGQSFNTTVEGVHPNDLGMRHYADAIEKVLRKHSSVSEPAVIKVCTEQVVGPVKPVNGVGQAPIVGLDDVSMFKYLKDAGIPYSRTHDVGGNFGGGVFFDVPNLFRDFDADENDPANYDFAFSDLYVKGLVDNGVEPYFRLGVSIENYFAVKAYRIFPPKDYEKWARICEHIIMHYTQGWADGFNYKISKWEIWNEPENDPSLEKNQMWLGSWDDYMELYKVASRHLKKKFPHLEIGGYGSCGFYAAEGGYVAAANSSTRAGYFVECFHKFLKFAKKNRLPLDFFSMHSYSDPAQALAQIRYAREQLDKFGFKDTKLSFNEWLPRASVHSLGTAMQAAAIGAELIALQNGPVDDAEIYDARCRTGAYSPLFDGLTHKPYKAYGTFLQFNELRKLGSQVALVGVPEDLFAVAAADGDGNCAVMLSNISGKTVRFAFDVPGYRLVETLAVDAANDFAMVPVPYEIAPDTVLLLRFAK
jgi:Glycosyl hydrolases family 39.